MIRKEMRRNGMVILALGALLFIQNCKEANFIENRTANEQLEMDLAVIEDYRIEENITFVEDSITYPVQYVILEEGTGKEVSPGDIVFFNYIIKSTDGTVFATSIKSVAEEEDIFSENIFYEPQLFTYTTTGWSVPNLINNVYGTTNHELGWKKGISAALSKMNVGGHTLIVVPSYLAYSNFSPFGIQPNPVMIFEAFITNAK